MADFASSPGRRLHRVAGWLLAVGVLAPLAAAAGEPMPPGEAFPDVRIHRQPRCATAEEIDRWFKPLDQVSLCPKQEGGPVPLDCSAGLFGGAGPQRPIASPAWTVFYWAPSNMAHQPAYWDRIPLERYGQSCHPLLEPLVSGAHFFAVFPIIPYKLGVDGTHDLVYTLGYYRIGDCAPATRQTLPWDWNGAALEAGAWTAGAFIIP
jgi:hypothetical protein